VASGGDGSAGRQGSQPVDFARLQPGAAALESELGRANIKQIERRFQTTLASDCAPDDVFAALIKSGHFDLQNNTADGKKSCLFWFVLEDVHV
jgi:hypothetical protein